MRLLDALRDRWDEMSPALRRGLLASIGLHVSVVLALLVGIKVELPEEPPSEISFAMQFEGSAPTSRRGEAPAPVAAAADAPETSPAPPAPEPPKQGPTEPPPPAPPPPPPSPNSQPNPTRNPAPMSQETLNTLEKLRALQRQERPPTARANPARGGAPNGGGNPMGDDTSLLSADQIRSIGDAVRRCWTYDAGARDSDKLQAVLTVRTDTTGMVRIADIAAEDQPKMTNPVFRAFAERARRAVLSPQCASLPLPRSMLGQEQTFTFRFRPLE